MVTAGYVERSVTVNGLKLAYQEWGNPSAPPIVMLHGFGVSGHMFDEFAERMQDRYWLLALDQRGHGDSDWSESGDYSREAFVEDLEGFRKALGLDRFILIGHSMGGLNAVSYVNTYPGHVTALVLVDVGPESSKEGVDNIVRFTRGPDELEFEEFVQMAHRFNPRRTLENIRERMRHRLKPTEGGKWTWKFDRRFRQPDSGITVGWRLSNDEMWQLFRNITIPTLLVRGAESDVLSAEVAERCVQEMPAARLVTIPGAGHSVPGDNPDAFTEAVASFLGEVQRGEFPPKAATEPPALQQLVEEQTTARRRGPGTMTLVLAGAGAVIALAGLGFLIRKGTEARRERRRPATKRAFGTVREAAPPIPPVDLELARERAAETVARLAEISARGARSARRTIDDADLSRARAAAGELLAALGETGRHAPELVREAAHRVESVARRRRKTGRAQRLLWLLPGRSSRSRRGWFR
ncbi:alpha/beta fold hydrolase [Tepidiforma thermophila]|uniref:Pimeloyl-ACP methyl ester carboxylesterase n=1 Tax=Tepidiforma thermophila (strain KCTC 52669 / CGMCC 1.13589 / G233) TaxID=2761530 RepID=A0A2A9HI92_TEPT2|nr:alpha/beta hydrolase [Tepidiforma thermophila]PFG74539.1 pimeloyl-ACP methyl ester carboxylesterase [Tepidiforma thermophila]